MSSVFWGIIFAAVFEASMVLRPVRGYEMCPSEKELCLQRHNGWRNRFHDIDANGQEMKDACDMKVLYWDKSLENMAKRHVGMCDNSHIYPEEEMREIAKAHGVSFDKLAVGQNVFETGKSDACGLQCADAVDIWHEEVECYESKRDKLAAECKDSGEVITHLTQEIWANTSYVGCAVNLCPGRRGKSCLVVCNYYWAGNYKRRPYTPERRRNCQCPEEYERDPSGMTNLCFPENSQEDENVYCDAINDKKWFYSNYNCFSFGKGSFDQAEEDCQKDGGHLLCDFDLSVKHGADVFIGQMLAKMKENKIDTALSKMWLGNRWRNNEVSSCNGANPLNQFAQKMTDVSLGSDDDHCYSVDLNTIQTETNFEKRHCHDETSEEGADMTFVCIRSCDPQRND